MKEQELTEQLKGFFREHHVPIFGIADSERLENEPEGYRPSDMLPSATSMVCFGIPLPAGMMKDKKRINIHYWRMASTYYGKLDEIASRLAVFFETKQLITTPVLS